MFPRLGAPELIIILLIITLLVAVLCLALVIVLLLFGVIRLPGAGSALGKNIDESRKASTDGDETKAEPKQEAKKDAGAYRQTR